MNFLLWFISREGPSADYGALFVESRSTYQTKRARNYLSAGPLRPLSPATASGGGANACDDCPLRNARHLGATP